MSMDGSSAFSGYRPALTVPQPQVGTTAQANGTPWVPQSVQHGDGNHAHGLFGLFGNRQTPVPPQYRMGMAGGSMPPEQTPSLGTTVQHFKQVGDPAQLNDFANFVRHEAPKSPTASAFGARHADRNNRRPVNLGIASPFQQNSSNAFTALPTGPSAQ
ncbi:MAG: hypothetical protein KC475_05705 [Cyanobacteria bacterium HKST-UBA03]|nr:hypothetical protein [Cyanobacteria bacterium HKST-UBA03]